MKYKRRIATGVLAFSLLAGGVSAFAADMTASTTKVNQYTNQVKMKSSTKQDKFDSVDTDLKTKKANRPKNKEKPSSIDTKVDAKDASGKDVESNDDSLKKTSTSTKSKISKVHKKTLQKTQIIKRPVDGI